MRVEPSGFGSIAEFRRQIGLPIHAVLRHGRVELKRTPAYFHPEGRSRRQGALEPALPDIAPRADRIGKDIDEHHSAVSLHIPDDTSLAVRIEPAMHRLTFGMRRRTIPAAGARRKRM